MASGYAPEVQSFNTKWSKIAEVTRSEGIPSEVAQAVYQQDLKRLQTPGSYTQNGDQLLDEIRTAAQGHPTITAPKASPTDVLGNLGTDVKSFGAGLMGLFNKGIGDVTQLAQGNPRPIENQVSALWRDPRVLEDPLKALTSNESVPQRIASLSNSPLLASLIPGVADLGALVKQGPHGQDQWQMQAGLDQLLEHPFTSILDVAPFLHGGGKLGTYLARAGLSDADRAAVETAASFKPTDVSPAAQAARAAAKSGSLGFLRYELATNPRGLLTFMNRFVLDLPFKGDTTGQYLARRINTATRGSMGPIAATVSRLMAAPGHEYQEGTAAAQRANMEFYRRHGMADERGHSDPEQIRKFTGFLTHYGDTAWARANLSPDELARFNEALPEYDAVSEELLNRGLDRHQLAMIRDPRNGTWEPRALKGTDAGVVNRYKTYLRRRPAFQEAAFKIASLIEHEIGAETPLRDMAGGIYYDFAPLRDFTDERYTDPAVVKAAFPTPPRGSPRVPYQLSKLFGPKGTLRAFELALQKGDMVKAGVAIRQVDDALRSKFSERNAQLSSMKKKVHGWRQALKLWNQDKTRGAIEGYGRALQKLTTGIDRYPVASTLPRYFELFREGLLRHLEGADVTEDDYNLVYDQVKHGLWNGETYESIVGAKEMAAIGNSARLMLRQERDAGFAPKWVPAISSRDIENLRRGAFDIERISEPSSYKSRVPLNPSAIYDPLLGLTVRQSEHLEEAVMQEFFYGEHGIKARFGVTRDQAFRKALLFVKDPGPGSMYEHGHAINDWINKNYVERTPESFLARKAAVAQTAKPSQGILLPRDVADAIDKAIGARRPSREPIPRLYQRGTNLFRYSLLNFSPRYQVHIWGAGSVLLMMRSDPVSMMRQLAPAVAMMARDSPDLVKVMHDLRRNALWRPVFDYLQRKGEKELANRGIQGGLPVELSHGTGESNPDLLAGYKWETGTKLGNWLKESMVGRGFARAEIPADAGMKLANVGANMLRATAYLIGERRGGEEAGLMFARKVFADMESMTPMERSIIRYVMPFYGWTRHILQYTATLPLDHPYRAMVISQMINQEWQDWNTGLPQSLVYLFQIGQTAPSGAATVLDIRQLDPLRSVNDVFTLGGFLSSLNPAIQTAVTGLGINTQTGDPSNLYPTLSFNQFYGTLQNQKTSLSSLIPQAIGQYVPEAGVLDHFLQLSSYTKWAAVNNQGAYMNQLYGALNMPWVPYNVNVYQEMAKTESDRYDIAKKAATSALSDPNPNSPQWQALMANYSYVPYSGYLVQPATLRSWAFDQVYRAGLWNGQTATLPPSDVISAPYNAPY